LIAGRGAVFWLESFPIYRNARIVLIEQKKNMIGESKVPVGAIV
jgi:hypothetical protein